MSSGSDASIIGYGKITPFSNINGNYVNVNNSNNPASFSSNEISGLPGLAGSKINVDAASGKVPGICLFKGGSKNIKRKIKNITKHYRKMKGGKKKLMSIKKRLRSKVNKKNKRTKRRRSQKGGYSQYQNNLPMTPTYSVGGVLSSNQLALANPPPIKVYPNCVNCTDNYNHFTGKGFPSKGH